MVCAILKPAAIPVQPSRNSRAPNYDWQFSVAIIIKFMIEREAADEPANAIFSEKRRADDGNKGFST